MDEAARTQLWRQRDRLTGALSSRNDGVDPEHARVLDELGDVYWQMGDLPAAGRCWYVIGRDDRRASLAIDAFEERFGHNLVTIDQQLRFVRKLQLTEETRAAAVALHERNQRTVPRLPISEVVERKYRTVRSLRERVATAILLRRRDARRIHVHHRNRDDRGLGVRIGEELRVLDRLPVIAGS